MARFFVHPDQVTANHVTIHGDDVKHLVRVLRLGIGDMITVLDGTGHEYEVRLVTMEREQVIGEIVASSLSRAEPRHQVTVIQGIPKGDKLETVIQKCTELGADAFIPVLTERSVVQLQAEKAARKQERWQKIAQEAAEQSRRGRVPAVHPVVTWRDLWTNPDQFDLILLAWEEERYHTLRQALEEKPNAQRIALVIGPEGGLSPTEVDLARRAGARTLTLGERILRTETAGMAILSMVMYHLGEVGGI